MVVSLPSLSFLDLLASSAIFLSLLGFFLTETAAIIRLLTLFLTFLAVFVLLVKRDRLLLALIAIYAGTIALLAAVANQVFVFWIALLLLGLLVTSLGSFLLLEGTPTDWFFILGGGFFAVELFWFISFWPFEPASKAAIMAIFFYGWWVAWRFLEHPPNRQKYLLFALWIIVFSFLVTWLAKWYI